MRASDQMNSLRDAIRDICESKPALVRRTRTRAMETTANVNISASLAELMMLFNELSSQFAGSVSALTAVFWKNIKESREGRALSERRGGNSVLGQAFSKAMGAAGRTKDAVLSIYKSFVETLNAIAGPTVKAIAGLLTAATFTGIAYAALWGAAKVLGIAIGVGTVAGIGLVAMLLTMLIVAGYKSSQISDTHLEFVRNK